MGRAVTYTSLQDGVYNLKHVNFFREHVTFFYALVCVQNSPKNTGLPGEEILTA